jgi:hypothetical protein
LPLLTQSISLTSNHRPTADGCWPTRWWENHGKVAVLVTIFVCVLLASRLTVSVTCERGSAKHCAKDDFAFLWKQVKFGYPPYGNHFADQDEI